MENLYRYVDLLNEDLKDSLTFYTSPHYVVLNKNLRTGAELDETINKHYNNILDIFAGAPSLDETVVVYRGMSRRHKRKHGLFISTTFDERKAKSFTNVRGKCCLFVITLTPGQYGVLPIEHVSEAPGEQEVLLPPGDFSIQKTVPASQTQIETIYCTYIPNDALIIETGKVLKEGLTQEEIENLSIQSWVDVLIEKLKDQIELICGKSKTERALDLCLEDELESLDFYDDIPEAAVNKFKILFSNIIDTTTHSLY